MRVIFQLPRKQGGSITSEFVSSVHGKEQLQSFL